MIVKKKYIGLNDVEYHYNLIDNIDDANVNENKNYKIVL